MNEQYEKSLTKLELDKVLAMLSDHAASQAAKDRCLAVRPSTDADEIRHLLDETSAACACITVKGSPSFGGVYDVGASLDRADRGGCLSPEAASGQIAPPRFLQIGKKCAFKFRLAVASVIVMQVRHWVHLRLPAIPESKSGRYS